MSENRNVSCVAFYLKYIKGACSSDIVDAPGRCFGDPKVYVKTATYFRMYMTCYATEGVNLKQDLCSIY